VTIFFSSHLTQLKIGRSICSIKIERLTHILTLLFESKYPIEISYLILIKLLVICDRRDHNPPFFWFKDGNMQHIKRQNALVMVLIFIIKATCNDNFVIIYDKKINKKLRHNNTMLQYLKNLRMLSSTYSSIVYGHPLNYIPKALYMVTAL
jgi:hypothetical protein